MILLTNSNRYSEVNIWMDNILKVDPNNDDALFYKGFENN